MKKLTLLILSLQLFVLNGFSQINSDKELNAYITKAPFKMPAIKTPVFPAKNFNIKNFGAVGDGQTLNTTAFKNAIEACAKAGGGKVVVPAGLWLTGPIEMKSNINLYVERGAVILFTRDFTQYPIIKASNSSTTLQPASPIYGYDLKNIAITGQGIIDGSGDAWRPVKKSKVTESEWKQLIKQGVLNTKGDIWWPSKEALEGEAYLKTLKETKPKPTAEDIIPARVFLRPHMVYFVNCQNILLDSITLRNSPKFVFYPNNSSNIIIRNTNVYNEWNAQNGDGIDISASKNVVIYKCNVSVGDDAICMKSSRGKSDDAKTYKLENIIIADNTVYHGHGGFVIGSNTDGNMKNIYVNNCSFIGTDIGIRVKSNAGRGGIVENIFISNIFMSDIKDEAISFDTYYEDVPAGKNADSVKTTVKDKIPEFWNFNISNVFCNGAKTAIFFRGLPEMPVHDLQFSNITISARNGLQGIEVANLKFDNVQIISPYNGLYRFNNAKNITLKNALPAEAKKPFVIIEGNVSGIKFMNANGSITDDAVQANGTADKKEVQGL